MIFRYSLVSLILFSFILCVSVSCNNIKTEKKDERPPQSHPAWQPGGNFPIGAWRGPTEKFNDVKTWKTVADAGFTFVSCDYFNTDDRMKALDISQKFGLKLILSKGEAASLNIYSNYQENLEIYKNLFGKYNEHPATFGYSLGDEPPYTEFGLYKEYFSLLEKLAPNKYLHCNLLPSESLCCGFGTINYADYLEKYIEIVKPMVLCYDDYALCQNGDKPYYFRNLEIVRRTGLKYNIPTWMYIQLTPHLNPYASFCAKGGGPYRALSLGEIRWEAYLALVYGMKGILYFTYWTEVSKKFCSEAHPDWVGIVDTQGRPTKFYDSVKTVNWEVRTLGKILLNLRSTDVFHTGQDIPIGCRRLDDDAILALPQKQPLILGLFKDADDKDYAMIVNRDYKNLQSFKVFTAKNIKAVYSISPKDGAEKALPVTDRFFELSLTPGNACLLRLETAYEYPKLLEVVPVPAGKIGAIWFPGEEKKENSTIYARKTFNLEKIPSNAKVFITADNEYVLYLNGQKIGEDKDWMKGEIYDVSRLLLPGQNAIAVNARNVDGLAGLFVYMESDDVQNKFYFFSDKSWKVTNKEDAGWTENKFDDSAWKIPVEIGKLPCKPWSFHFKGFVLK